jgi:nicotinamide-nucleotide amidase
VAVGTELLLGQIVNTNAQHISRALASIGIDVYAHTVVGDNLERVAAALDAAAGRADAVVVTGGLGPTPDDLTREAVSAWLGRPLGRDPGLVTKVTEIFARLGRSMPEANLRQADLPEGAEPIAPEGTAPGFVVENDGVVLAALPGVPWEMKAMLEGTVLPLLARRAGAGAIVSREVLVIGLGESATHERIADIVDAQSNPTLAYLAGSGRVRVRITAKAADDAAARELIDPVESEVRARLGDAAVPEHASLSSALGALLIGKGATVAVAESLTGGLLAAELTEEAGASDFFAGSLVVYSNEAKARVAGVDETILAGPGAVSEEAAGALARGAAARYAADLGLSTTGVAGPAEQEGKPPGTIFVGACWRGRVEVRRVRGYGDRANMRALAVTAALDLGRRVVS